MLAQQAYVRLPRVFRARAVGQHSSHDDRLNDSVVRPVGHSLKGGERRIDWRNCSRGRCRTIRVERSSYSRWSTIRRPYDRDLCRRFSPTPGG